MIEDGRPGRAAYCVASESCAFDLIGATLPARGPARRGRHADRRRRADADGRRRPSAARSACSSTSTSRGPTRGWRGTVLQVARARMGEILWREAPVEADLVIPVPDSGNAAARGLARAAGLPQDDGFIKNRYVARTFIQPGQELRRHGLRLKFNPLPEVVAGKRLIVVDDSIVRGNTTRQIVQMLREAGAAEIHLRISAPPIKHPCHYGIDMSTPRGDDRPRARRSRRSPPSSAPTRCTTCRWRASTRRSAVARDATATRASAANIRFRGPRRRTASTRSSCRSSGHSRSGARSRGSRSSPPVRGRTSRRCSTRSTVGRGSRSWRSPPTSRRRRRSTGRGAPGSRCGPSRRPSSADRGARDRAMADWLAERGTSSSSSLAGYMQLLSAEFLARFPDRVDQRPPGAAAGLPRAHAVGRRWRTGPRCSASRSTSSTAASTGPGDPPARDRAARRHRRATTCSSGCIRSSTSCCPRPSG